MSVVIFGDLFQFPEGTAATNRVYTFAKGFQERNLSVHVICFGNDYVKDTQGIVDGIHYYYPFRQQSRNKYFLVRRWKVFAKYVRTFALLKKINKEDKVEAIISYSNFLDTNIFSYVLAKSVGAKLLAEINEYPLRYFRSSPVKRIQGRIKVKIESGIADGIMCITPFLVNFYKQRGVKEEKLFLLPSTVDASRFKRTGEKPLPYPYIGYFGGLTFDRDNVDLLIRAFAKVASKHPAFRLVLSGVRSQQDEMNIHGLAAELGVQESVNLLALLPRHEITPYITHADLLVMVRKHDVLSQASFPSKLSEFLATSNPVVTVKVGDIEKYLTDNMHAFLVEPDNVDELAAKLNFALMNHENAKEVGRRGHELTTSVFNYNYQAKRMKEFIDTLKN